MADISQFNISSAASLVAERFKTSLYFKDGISAAKFAAMFMMQHCTEPEIISWVNNTSDPTFDRGGNYYSKGSIDNKIVDAIKAVYPECEIPNQYIRVLMDKGLVTLGDKIHSLEDLLVFLKEEAKQ